MEWISRKFSFLAVLDFEATCADRNSRSDWDLALQEIIEIPVALLSAEHGSIVDIFSSFVRPTRQPTLTEFCTRLTSIQQSDVDASPDITRVMDMLVDWFASHRATRDNTLVVTCGDWDLKSMWPRQVSLTPNLQTPNVFRTWCNLKLVYGSHTHSKPAGMMGMLNALHIPHLGHHHRGLDDVRNLSRIVVSLLRDGATFRPTWTEKERSREYQFWNSKQSSAQHALLQKREALLRLPPRVPSRVRIRLEKQIRELEAFVVRTSAIAQVFAGA